VIVKARLPCSRVCIACFSGLDYCEGGLCPNIQNSEKEAQHRRRKRKTQSAQVALHMIVYLMCDIYRCQLNYVYEIYKLLILYETVKQHATL
jgi:hypothetical protein